MDDHPIVQAIKTRGMTVWPTTNRSAWVCQIVPDGPAPDRLRVGPVRVLRDGRVEPDITEGQGERIMRGDEAFVLEW